MKDRHRAARVAGDREMLRLIAELYYLRELRQPEIASLTGFSVSKVSRLLAEARDAGVVRISIEPATDVRPTLARELSHRFGVAVEITPGREADPVSAARVCGVAAADRVVRWLPASGAIGLAGGYTVDALVASLPRLDRPDLTIVPVVGGWDQRNPYLDTNELVRRMAERLSAQVRFLHAPGILDRAETKDALLQDSAIAATARYWASLTLAIVGVSGGPLAKPGYATVMDRLDDASRRRLADQDVAGDIAGHLFRVDGAFVEDAWGRRTISMSLDELRRIPRVVAVAAGSNKVPALLGALRTGTIHVLITDAPTAEAVMHLADADDGDRRARREPAVTPAAAGST